MKRRGRGSGVGEKEQITRSKGRRRPHAEDAKARRAQSEEKVVIVR